jgi:hypothetical protein
MTKLPPGKQHLIPIPSQRIEGDKSGKGVEQSLNLKLVKLDS